MLRHVHVVGAGLAGLNAALHLVDAGITVTLHEAAKRAGGRCRSYPDPVLGLEIDNGNHLMLSGNSDIRAFLARSDASANWWGPDRAEIPFLDLPSGARWSFQPGPGCSPLWLFDAKRRAPGTSLWDYLKALRLSKAGRFRPPRSLK
ncbi:MAG: FAD-dependent oxidoreductase [Rhodospirillales bacterium]